MPSYATHDDLVSAGLSASIVDELDPTVVHRALARRSSFAEDFVARFYKLPLTKWGASISISVAQLAARELVSAVVGCAARGRCLDVRARRPP